MGKLKKFFFADRWHIFYRITSESLVNFGANKQPFVRAKMPKGYWGADPFLIKQNGKIFVYCEYTCEKKSKSVIAYKELFPNESKDWSIACEFYGHTSYPCIFFYCSELYMIPETTFARNVVVLKFNFSISKWQYHSELISNSNSPDTTFFEFGGKPFIFLYEILDNNHRDLFLCELNRELTQVLTKKKISSYFLPDGRPGGKCVFEGNKSYRIVQPGIKHYGERIDIYNFSLKNHIYKESKHSSVLPTDLIIKDKRRLIGVHTFNSVDNLEVIDCLLKSKFDLLRPFKLVLKRLKVFGYGQWDQEGKILYKDYLIDIKKENQRF